MQTKKKISNFKVWLIPALAISLLVSCNPTSLPSGESGPTDSSVETTEPTISDESSTQDSVDTTESSETTEVSTETTDKSEDLTDTSTGTPIDPTVDPSEDTSVDTSEKPTGKIEFDVFTLNDFHGATQYVSQTYPAIGLAKLSTVFRTFAAEQTSFFLSSGDMWQETIESNSNRGAYVTEAFNRIGLDAMTIGNHEFDWGVKYIVDNSKIADYPFLAANIFNKTTGEYIEGTEPSTIIERDGLKVGVIGVIGPAQYNSISYQQVAEYEFLNEYNYVINEAKFLREKGADVIILSSHDGFANDDMTAVKKAMINDASIDMVIAGHTHTLQNESFTRDDGQEVPLIQAYSKGTAFGHVSFTYDFDSSKLTVDSRKVENFKNYAHYEADQEIIDLYNEKYNVDDLKTEHIVEAKTDFSKEEGGILASTAIYEKIRSMDEYKDYDIIAGYHNTARNAIAKGNLNYEGLFNSYPFDNEIIIYAVNSSYISRGYYYFQTGFTKTSFTGTKYIAAIDYIAYKTIGLDKGVRTGLFVRDILKEYLQNKKVITASDYYN